MADLIFDDVEQAQCAFSGEASRSTLKYLLTIPVGRTRLLFVKVLVSSTVLVVGILLLTGTSLLVGTISYGGGGIQIPVGPQLGMGESLRESWRRLRSSASTCHGRPPSERCSPFWRRPRSRRREGL